MTNETTRDAHILTTLDDLAKRRRHCTMTIVSLCAFYQVDPAPYLDAAVAVATPVPGTADERRKIERRAKTKTPRPRRPASHATNGTGRAHKVSTGDRILAALAKHGAMSPRELATQVDMSVAGLSYQLKKLEAAKQVALTGTTADRRVSLA